jgi:hypothetical protein
LLLLLLLLLRQNAEDLERVVSRVLNVFHVLYDELRRMDPAGGNRAIANVQSLTVQ